MNICRTCLSTLVQGDEVVAPQADFGNRKSQPVSPARRMSIELMKRTHSSPDVGVLAFESRTERLFNEHRRLEVC